MVEEERRDEERGEGFGRRYDNVRFCCKDGMGIVEFRRPNKETTLASPRDEKLGGFG